MIRKKGPQRIWVFQQNGSGEQKIHGVRAYGGDLFVLDTFSVDSPLPSIINDSNEYLPDEIEADLVLDFFKHPDLSTDLANACELKKIPVVASGKTHTGRWVFDPPTWCALPRQVCLGKYGERFGLPEFEVRISGSRIVQINVSRGAPCGATWRAAEKIVGANANDAGTALGLAVQVYCTADPAGWDTLRGKSPVHIAGDVHKAAFNRAVKLFR